ncbi:MAG: tetratricopeptide repeat-containing sensor histidine kinase [Bacteroidia bacterium]|nr:tetratricopeptide repeat-containing sensor histidine kinase [Bacteroidia bacterium]
MFNLGNEEVVKSDLSAETTSGKKGISDCYNNLGVTYLLKGNYDKAIDYFMKSVKIREELGDKRGMSACFTNIGIIHTTQGFYNKALYYYLKSLKIKEEIGDKNGMSKCYTSLGNVYYYQNKYDSAIFCYSKSLKIYNELSDKIGMSDCYINIGSIYCDQRNYAQAFDAFFFFLKMYEELGNKYGISTVLGNIATLYVRKKNYYNGIQYAEKSLNIAKEIGSLYLQNLAFYNLSVIYDSLSNYKKAFEYYKFYKQINDSIFNEESGKQIKEMEARYQTEKKQKQIELLSKEKQIQKTEIKQQRTQKYAFITGLIFVIIFAYIIYRSYRQKKKDNRLLEAQNIEIKNQKEQLSETLDTLRRTQAQLVESEKMASLGNLVAGVAHEINTPVGIGITGASSLIESTKQFAQLYKENKMSRKELEEYLDNAFQTGKLILNNMQRTGELVRTFKQVSVDQMTEEKRKFLLKSYLEDILFSLKPEFGKKQIKIAVEMHGSVKTNSRSSLRDDIEIDSYPGIFAQIITNLVLNSIRHGFRDTDNGEIRFIAFVETHGASTPLSNPRASLQMQYMDNGCGISPENLPKIFDPFFTTNKQVGTGLGLNIVYNLVTQKLKGTIKCESEVEQGAKFIIDVPFFDQPARSPY